MGQLPRYCEAQPSPPKLTSCCCIRLDKLFKNTENAVHWNTDTSVGDPDCDVAQRRFLMRGDLNRYAAGISKFDGLIFENFTIQDGLPGNEILLRALMATRVPMYKHF